MTILEFSPLPSEFEAVARCMSPTNSASWFDSDMDQLMFLKEDVPYRTDRVDGFVTLFWHGQEERLVGMKFKGFRSVYALLVEDFKLAEGEFIFLIRFVQYAMRTSLTTEVLEDIAKRRLEKKYEQAKKEFSNSKISLKVLEAA